MNWQSLANDIKSWGLQLGFAQIGITNTELAQYEARFLAWIAKGYHGEMDYLTRHGSKRTHPAELVPNTTTIITARMDYLPPNTHMVKNLQNPVKAYISRYAVGQDYHKLLRKKLEKLAPIVRQYWKNH
jgi:epoxyqueuosine reductase